MAKPEGIFELPLHGLHVRVLDKEGGTELTKLSELDLARAVLVDLRQQVLQLLLGGTEAHRPHDLAEVICGQELHLLGVEQVEADLQALDLIGGQTSGLVQLLKVNSLKLVRHLDRF